MFEQVEVNSERWFDLTPLKNEEFRDIKGYEGLYQVSNYGRVKSLERKQYYRRKINNHILKEGINEKGYGYICLCKSKISHLYRTHRLVALAFIPNPNNLPEVNHKDENKLNNKVDNIHWCNRQYNINYGNRNKKHAKKMCKKINQYDEKGNLIKTWNSLNEASEKLGINASSISNCCRKRTKTYKKYVWKYENEVI